MNPLLAEEEGKHAIRSSTHAVSWYIPLETVETILGDVIALQVASNQLAVSSTIVSSWSLKLRSFVQLLVKFGT